MGKCLEPGFMDGVGNTKLGKCWELGLMGGGGNTVVDSLL